MSDIVIASAVRTPIGSFNGVFAGLAAHQLGRVAIEAALARAGVAAADVSEVVLGEILSAGEGQNPARQASMAAGIPKEVTAMTINQVCGSGLRAVALGYQAIKAGDSRIVIAGEIGYERHAQFTVIGDVVNVAARLQDLTKAFACEVLIAEEVFRRAGLPPDSLPAHEVDARGRDGKVKVRAAVRAADLGALASLDASYRRTADHDR